MAKLHTPRRSIANRHSIRRLHMCANRKSGSSKLFGRSGPTYTPYHMMAESRPLYLLLRLIGAPLRLRRRYHADPLLIGTAFVVYICTYAKRKRLTTLFTYHWTKVGTTYYICGKYWPLFCNVSFRCFFSIFSLDTAYIIFFWGRRFWRQKGDQSSAVQSAISQSLLLSTLSSE